MDYRDKIAWLRRYQDSLRRQRVLELEVERLRSEAERITPLLSGMPGGGSNPDKLPRGVEAIVQARQDLVQQVAACRDVQREVEHVIDQVANGREQEILRRRYILGQRWEVIAVDMGIEYRWVWRLHKRTLNHLTIKGDI